MRAMNTSENVGLINKKVGEPLAEIKRTYGNHI